MFDPFLPVLRQVDMILLIGLQAMTIGINQICKGGNYIDGVSCYYNHLRGVERPRIWSFKGFFYFDQNGRDFSGNDFLLSILD